MFFCMISEYFKCFVHLSDWEGFIEKVLFQYNKSSDNDASGSSSVSSFNYDILWEKPWTKNFILPLIFDANIHRLSLVNVIQDIPRLPKNERKNIIEQFQNFDNYVDNWNGKFY